MTSPGWSGKWFLLRTCGSFSRTRTKTNATVNMANARFSVSGTCLCMCFFLFIGFVSANYLDEYLYSTDQPNFKENLMINIEFLENIRLHNQHKRDVSWSVKDGENLTTIGNNDKYTQVSSKAENKPETLGSTKTKRGLSDFGSYRSLLASPSILGSSKATENETQNTSFNKVNSEEGVGEEISPKDLISNNITSVKKDNHIFYNSSIDNTVLAGKSQWIDMDNASEVTVHELLSNSHRRAATVKLSFEFPFYGRYLKNVTIATGGFLYTGNYVHSWLAATQYIAPLMANFDTSISNKSFVKYLDNGTTFTVVWEKVALQDKPTYEFTFQTSLHKNGDIVFVYKNVPLPIADISEVYHPVKVGLSDAYILDRTLIYVRRKTIYEYHRVTFNKEEIRNWTVIYLKPLPSCQDLLNCSSCIHNDLNLNCTWCPTLQQCSTGQDRNRQFWMDNGCERSNITTLSYCTFYDIMRMHDLSTGNASSQTLISKNLGKIIINRQQELGISGYLAIIFLIVMVAGVGLWTTYAYKNPHTTSGQILIRYRPSQWRWRRGEARYTAATIHM